MQEKLAQIQKCIEQVMEDTNEGKVVIFIKDGEISGWQVVTDYRA